MADEDIPPWEKKEEDVPPWEKTGTSTQQQKPPDQPWSVLGTLKQLPLGIARGATQMVEAMAPAGMGEAIASNPALYDTLQDQAKTTGAENAIPNSEDYHKEGQELLTKYGIEGANSPKNAPERIMSATGEAIPWAAGMGGGPGFLGNVAVGAVGGAGGAGAQEFVSDKNKPIAGIVGSLVSSLGAAGALHLGNMLVNMLGRPYRQLPGAASEFGIPATKGMIGEDLPSGVTQKMQLAQEEAMAQGAKGKAAQVIMERQRIAREQVMRDVEGKLTAGVGGETTPVEAAEVVSHGVKTEAERLRSEADKLFESAAAKNAWVLVEDSRRPSLVIDDALSQAGFKLNESHQAASRAYRLIQNMESSALPETAEGIGVAAGSTGPRAIPLAKVNETRKALGAMKATSREDGLALGKIKSAFDDFEKVTVDGALLSGDKTALDDLLKARPMWRRYRQMTDADPKQDYRQVLSAILGKEQTPEQVAGMLLGNNSINMSSRASRVARYIKNTFGEDSEEWQSLRQAYLKQALTTSPNAEREPRAIAKAITAAIDNKGAPLARTLFSEQELDRLRRYRNALYAVSPALQNPPRTAYAHWRLAWGAITGLAAAASIGTTAETHDYRWLALGALPFVRDGRNAMRALEAVTQTKHLPPLTRGVLGGAAPFASQYGNQ